jgi:hypothetical protein
MENVVEQSGNIVLLGQLPRAKAMSHARDVAFAASFYVCRSS